MGKKATGRLRNPEAAMGFILSLDKRRIAPGMVHGRDMAFFCRGRAWKSNSGEEETFFFSSSSARKLLNGSEELAIKSPDH